MGTAIAIIQAKLRIKNSIIMEKSSPLLRILPSILKTRLSRNSRVIINKLKIKGPKCLFRMYLCIIKKFSIMNESGFYIFYAICRERNLIFKGNI